MEALVSCEGALAREREPPQARKMETENVPGEMKSAQGTCSQKTPLSVTHLLGRPLASKL